MSLDKLLKNEGVNQKDIDVGYTIEIVPEDKDAWDMPMMREDDSAGFVDRNNYWDRI